MARRDARCAKHVVSRHRRLQRHVTLTRAIRNQGACTSQAPRRDQHDRGQGGQDPKRPGCAPPPEGLRRPSGRERVPDSPQHVSFRTLRRHRRARHQQTAASARESSSGGAEPIATPIAAASSSGNVVPRRPRPQAFRRGGCGAGRPRSAVPHPCPRRIDHFDEVGICCGKVRALAQQRAEIAQVRFTGTGSSTSTILIVGRSANAARSEGTTDGHDPRKRRVALRKPVDLLEIQRVIRVALRVHAAIVRPVEYLARHNPAAQESAGSSCRSRRRRSRRLDSRRPARRSRARARRASWRRTCDRSRS